MKNDDNLPLIQTSEILQIRLKEIPLTPGVYLMRDQSDRILYIGKSKKLRSRVQSYFRESQSHSPRIGMMVKQVTDIEFIVTDTEAEALVLESNLIKKHNPYYNILLKDDKKYPYICITWSEKYPRIFITRKRKVNNIKDRYYGPYVDTNLLRKTLEIIQQNFPLRQRRKPLFKNRPCLNYDLDRCPGVCQELITPENYHKIVEKVAMIFQGRTTELINILTNQMLQASENLKFEIASKIRDQIQNLGVLNITQKISSAEDTSSKDAIALAFDNNHSCIQLFQIRAGNLVNRLGFFVNLDDFSPPIENHLGVILQKVLEDHYSYVESLEIPKEILVQYALPHGEILKEWLTQKKGQKVDILIPQRQAKAELIDLVQKNAQYELIRTQKSLAKNITAMEDLANILNISFLPKRIEGYDISHLQGSNAVGSQVVFIDGIPAKQHYRHYNIKNPRVKIGHSDDFASLAEVIKRRFKPFINLPKEDLNQDHNFPNLLMIDGGKGQLSAVVEVLEEVKLLPYLTVVSLAKKREEIFLPYQSFPLETDPDQPGVQLLRRLRDEAHRFAVTFHRQQRLKNSKISYLEDIPGLGFQRQKQLLAHFHSIDYIREATITQLMEVSGIGLNLAQEIFNYFHN
jgi:excinuclease ABC subunit C